MPNIKTIMASFFLLPSLLSVTLFPTLLALPHIVTHLPGFQGPLPFHLETGYVNVDEVNGWELFYYFTASERSPREDPLILWLTGGPGCSGLKAFLLEIGPLKFAETTEEYIDGSIPSMVYNNYSWTKVANIIFLDSPVGTGFSYSESPNVDNVSDTMTIKLINKFIRKWLLENPQFNSNDLYIGGDSYSGKIVPAVAQYIAQDIEAMIQPLLNLKGYLVGNPLNREADDLSSRIPFAHGQGLISYELYQTIGSYCTTEDYIDPSLSNKQCAYALNSYQLLIDGINTENIIEPLCSPSWFKGKVNAVGHRSLYQNFLSNTIFETKSADQKCRSHYFTYIWSNINSTRQALNIREGTVDAWHHCNRNISYTQDIESSLIYHLNVTQKGYRALVYSGDKDMIFPFIGTQEWIRSLNYSIIDEWRSWRVQDQVAGYTRSYSNNLTFATVKDAGHTAPEYKPENCLMMLSRWISHRPI